MSCTKITPTQIKSKDDSKKTKIIKSKPVKSKIKYDLDKLRKSKEFRELGDMLYID